MIDIDGIFKNRILNVERLSEFGFSSTESGYIGFFELSNLSFQMIVVISQTEDISVKVIDLESNEEYVLIHMPEIGGAFVNTVIQACENKLRLIAEKCFDYKIFKNTQTKQIIDYVNDAYHDKPEFLWKKTPNNAIVRRKDTKKWYAVILTISKAKLGFDTNEIVEIIDLRGSPDEIARLIDGQHYLLGYHMNKKHWYTMCLDHSISTEEICNRIDKSYLLATK